MKKILSASLVVLVTISCFHAPSAGALPNWQNLDLQTDGVFGISTEKVYDQLLRNKKANTVIVAVIDSGIDTLQEDLRPVLWTDPKDGSHGRNYVGPETGKEDFIPMLATTKDVSGYRKTLDDYHLHVNRLNTFINELKAAKKVLDQILRNIDKEHPLPEDIRIYRPRNQDETRICDLILDRLHWYPNFDRFKFCEVDQLIVLGQYHLEHGLNMNMAAQDTVRFAYTAGMNADVSNDAMGLVADPSKSEHGTMMSGVIAAVRNNGKGINGIADHARIMMLKLFGNIREMRNDDLASAIRYAVDHGARVISMSFGKTFSWHREVVDTAVRYAMAHDVLVVHAAGNNGMDLDADSNLFFPSPVYLHGGVASAWITVGASGYRNDAVLAAPFSNYGRNSVDVFAPGVQITSTSLHAGLDTWEGSSMAAPVVAGLAALVWTYYPALTAVQVKEIIMQSVVKTSSLKNKCLSGGVVNAYNAIKLAADYK